MEIALGSVDLISTCSGFLCHKEDPLAITAQFSQWGNCYRKKKQGTISLSILGIFNLSKSVSLSVRSVSSESGSLCIFLGSLSAHRATKDRWQNVGGSWSCVCRGSSVRLGA